MTDNQSSKAIYLLTLACALGILWRSVGADWLDFFCAVVGVEHQVERGRGYMTQLVTMAGLIIAGRGADKLITKRRGGKGAKEGEE